jgi:hypothetical protein
VPLSAAAQALVEAIRSRAAELKLLVRAAGSRKSADRA